MVVSAGATFLSRLNTVLLSTWPQACPLSMNRHWFGRSLWELMSEVVWRLNVIISLQAPLLVSFDSKFRSGFGGCNAWVFVLFCFFWDT